ncbi:MAG: hypothetical protein P8Y40_07910 [Desulfobacterales bacterium]
MKITGLELFHISIPFCQPYKLSKVYGTLTDAHAVVLKVHTDAGIVGLGEADPKNPFTTETPASVMAVIANILHPIFWEKTRFKSAKSKPTWIKRCVAI